MTESIYTLARLDDLAARDDLRTADGLPRIERRELLPPMRVDIAPIAFGEDLSARTIHEQPGAGAWRQDHYHLGPFFYYVLRDVLVHSTVGIMAVDGHVVAETLESVYYPEHGLRQGGEPGTIAIANRGTQHLPGRALHQLASGAKDNYYHWMLDVVARLAVCPDPADADRLLLPAFETAFQEPTLDLIGSGRPQRRIYLGLGESARIDELVYVPNVAGWGWSHRPEIVGIFDRMKAALGPLDPPNRRLYVSRRGAGKRPMVNEDAVAALLAERGFEILHLETMDVAAQIRAFAEAAHIVAPHGAGLTNLIFCAPGTTVCELHLDHYVNWCFQRLANLRGLRYGCLVGSALTPRNEEWPHATPWAVDTDALQRVL